MSPTKDPAMHEMTSFPRVSGDEPVLESLDSLPRPFSPRERG